MDQRRLLPVAILDWYDGIVLAVTRTSWQPGVSLVSLVAWVQPERKRILALVPVTEEEASAIMSMDWTALGRYLAMLAARLACDILVVGLDKDQGEVIGEVSVPAKDIREDLFGDAESALSAERARWGGPL